MKRKILLTLLTISMVSGLIGCNLKEPVSTRDNTQSEQEEETLSDSTTEEATQSTEKEFLYEKYEHLPQPDSVPTMTIMGRITWEGFTGAPVNVDSLIASTSTISYTFTNRVEDAPASELYQLQGYLSGHEYDSVFMDHNNYIKVHNITDEELPASTCMANGWWYYHTALDTDDSYEECALLLGVPYDAETDDSLEDLFDKFVELVGPPENVYYTWDSGNYYAYIMCFEMGGHIFEIEILQLMLPTINRVYYYPVEYKEERIRQLKADVGYDGNVFEVLK